MKRLLDSIRQTLADASAEQREHVAGNPIDREAIVVLVTTCVVMTLQYYCVTSRYSLEFDEWLLARLPTATQEAWRVFDENPANSEISRLGRWTIGNIFLYVVIPLVVIKLIFRRNLADYGAKIRGATQGWQWYAVMLAVMLPCVFLASLRPSFQGYYPFYRLSDDESLWPRFIIWEVLYALQFIALEFYFRGFMVHGTKRALGALSIFVMTIPYCMIHFGKPMPEAFGAIGAGVVLGFMSLKTRSVWMGAGLHICVAWTMDTLALIQRFGIFT